MAWQRLWMTAVLNSHHTSAGQGIPLTVCFAIIRSLALDLLRAAARGGADSSALKRCLSQAPPEQAMYLVLLHNHREQGNLRVSSVLQSCFTLHTICDSHN